MICNRCGNEFGDGDVCEYCGSDKVTALGEFSGYSVPKSTANTEHSTSIDPTPRHVASPHIDSMPSHVAFPRMDDMSSLICWKCGEVIPGDSKYCPVCGTMLFVNCPNCGHKYSAKYPHCNQCGTNREEYQKAKEVKEREAKEREAKEREAVLHKIKHDEDFRLVFNYIRNMAIYFELNTMFVNLSSDVKTDYLKQYFIDHYPRINNLVRKVVSFILLEDISYWNRRDCLDELALEEECARAFSVVNVEVIYR